MDFMFLFVMIVVLIVIFEFWDEILSVVGMIMVVRGVELILEISG